METTAITQRRPLNGFHQRKERSPHRTHIPVNGHLPTADTLRAIGAPEDIVAQVQIWHDLKLTERDQGRKAAAANGQVEAAEATYRSQVREALAAGSDPAKVKNDAAKHKAVAEAHTRFATDARDERARLGYTLGAALEEIAPTLFAPAEEQIEQRASVLRESLAALRGSWSGFSEAFILRTWLSDLAIKGGMVGAYHGATGLPPEVVAALAVLEDHAGSLDKLKQDEAEVQSYREANARAKQQAS